MEEKKNILVIEDSYEVRSTIVEILEKFEYATLSVADGKSALNLMQKVKPDLIICDVMMPGMDGYEVLNEVNKLFQNENPVPFIFLTAKTDILDVRKGMSLGADDYITKPFRAQELISSIEVRLQKIEKFRQYPKEPAIEQALYDEPRSSVDRLKENQGIMISNRKKTVFVKVKNIVYISAEGDYTNVNLIDGKKVLASKLLKEWEKILPQDLFYRTHRSFIINIDQIEEIIPWFKRSYKIKLKNAHEDVFISERYAGQLKKVINK